MPHLVLEYSDNITPHVPMDTLLAALHKNFTAFETIPLDDTKTRAKGYSHYVVGSQGHQMAFMHLNILMMKGRPQELRTKMGEAMVNFLKMQLAHYLPTQLPSVVTVEIREMEKSDYFKSA
ncbi:MAG: 5-carboxymethyl-2-hydroxymuconate Delta-isomerase [Gammaproteobacteria bacterium]